MIGHFGFVLRNTLAEKSCCYHNGGHRFRTVFHPHESEKAGLKSVFEKLRFPYGSVWTMGLLTAEIKLFFKFLLRSVEGALHVV